jgi:glycosyltransferase involved in cell wall biosynthesis
MKICLVSAFPPGHERLNEYGYHLAIELQKHPLLSVTVLADRYKGELPESDGFDVVRCWQPDELGNPLALLAAVRDIQPDVVWFNLVFSSFGVNPAAAFLGLCTPALVRAAGFNTHVTLHHLMENIDLEDSKVRFPRLYRGFGRIATHLLLLANSVSVLLPAYRRTLRDKYHSYNVHLRSHGVFSPTPQYPDFSRRGDPHRILAFGKWGTYKRLELLLDSFGEIQRAVPGCRLVIAGENHPMAPGYVERLRTIHGGNHDVEFAGYVKEEDLPELFGSATLLAMPYSSATGSSGVAHLACQFGLPIVCADLPDFRDMAQEEGVAMDLYRVGDQQSLTAAIIRLLEGPDRQREMAEQNYAAAVRNTMPQIVRQYLRSFEWQLRGVRRLQSAWGLRQRQHPVAPSWSSSLIPAPRPLVAMADDLRIPEPAFSEDTPACPDFSAQIYNLKRNLPETDPEQAA